MEFHKIRIGIRISFIYRICCRICNRQINCRNISVQQRIKRWAVYQSCDMWEESVSVSSSFRTCSPVAPARGEMLKEVVGRAGDVCGDFLCPIGGSGGVQVLVGGQTYTNDLTVRCSLIDSCLAAAPDGDGGAQMSGTESATPVEVKLPQLSQEEDPLLKLFEDDLWRWWTSRTPNLCCSSIDVALEIWCGTNYVTSTLKVS